MRVGLTVEDEGRVARQTKLGKVMYGALNWIM